MNLSYLRIVVVCGAMLLAAIVGGCTKGPAGETASADKEMAATQGSELLQRLEALHPNDTAHEILKELSIEQAKDLAEEVYKLRLKHPAPLTFSEFMLLSLTSHKIQFVSITPDGTARGRFGFRKTFGLGRLPSGRTEKPRAP
jgi:hypothetical protein